MTATIDSIFRPEELQTARAVALDELLDQQKVFSRRANDPAARVAHAEIEQVIRRTRAEWVAVGLLASVEGLAS